MIENVQIIKNNGDSLSANALAHFKFNDSNKEYVVYYLGEETDDGKKKIHIGYINGLATEVGIGEDESAQITTILKMVGKGEDVTPLITFLPIDSQSYNIHDKVKKVGVPERVMNNIVVTQQNSNSQIQQIPASLPQENIYVDTNDEPNINEVPVQDNNVSVFPEGSEMVMQELPQQSVIGEEATNSIEQVIPVSNDEVSQTMETNNPIQMSDGNNSLSGSVPVDVVKNIIFEMQSEFNNLLNNKIQELSNYEFVQENNVNTNLNDNKSEIVESPSGILEETIEPNTIDVVKELELAPEPAITSDVLGDETDLSSGIADGPVVNDDDTKYEVVDNNINNPLTDNGMDFQLNNPEVLDLPIEVPTPIVQNNIGMESLQNDVMPNPSFIESPNVLSVEENVNLSPIIGNEIITSQDTINVPIEQYVQPMEQVNQIVNPYQVESPVIENVVQPLTNETPYMQEMNTFNDFSQIPDVIPSPIAAIGNENSNVMDIPTVASMVPPQLDITNGIPSPEQPPVSLPDNHVDGQEFGLVTSEEAFDQSKVLSMQQAA